jgi:hypothetical protein
MVLYKSLNNMPEPTSPPVSVFDHWLAEWISAHPPADDIESAKEVYTTSELMHAYFLNTMDEGVFQEAIHKALNEAGYTLTEAGWLTA